MIAPTLRGLHDERLAVLSHPAGVEGLHPGLVRAIEVEPIHRADGLRAHVHFLQHTGAHTNTHTQLHLQKHSQ